MENDQKRRLVQVDAAQAVSLRGRAVKKTQLGQIHLQPFKCLGRRGFAQHTLQITLEIGRRDHHALFEGKKSVFDTLSDQRLRGQIEIAKDIAFQCLIFIDLPGLAG